MISDVALDEPGAARRTQNSSRRAKGASSSVGTLSILLFPTSRVVSLV